MKKNKYKRLLIKMFILESLGERLYDKLYKKTDDIKLEQVYKKLAEHELSVRKHIEQELLNHAIASPILLNKIAFFVANLFFYFSSRRMLDRILRIILKRKIYSKWYNLFNSNNIELWNILLEHEKLQHKMLMI